MGKWIFLWIVLMAIVCIIIAIFLRHRQKVSVSTNQGVKEIECSKKTAKKVRIQVTCNGNQQINIYCYDLEEQQLGELLAEYTLRNSLTPEKKPYAVHIEQLYVKRGQREKGIGKLMFAYLLREMQSIEKQNGCDFAQIYGEVGKDGSDDPRKSLPFYEHMQKLPYGQDRQLSYQLHKKQAMDGLDLFVYHIVKRR